jgi:type IV pilus assembly protein PilP
VQPGNYMGQNHGKITRVTESDVELTEIIPDGLGGWMERQASIAISE